MIPARTKRCWWLPLCLLVMALLQSCASLTPQQQAQADSAKVSMLHWYQSMKNGDTKTAWAMVSGSALASTSIKQRITQYLQEETTQGKQWPLSVIDAETDYTAVGDSGFPEVKFLVYDGGYADHVTMVKAGNKTWRVGNWKRSVVPPDYLPPNFSIGPGVGISL